MIICLPKGVDGKGEMLCISSEVTPIMVGLTEKDRRNIAGMVPGAKMYIEYGEPTTGEEADAMLADFEDVLDNLGIAYSYTPEQAIPKGYQFYTCCNKYKWMPDWKPKFTLQAGLKDYKSNHFISGGIGQFSDESSMLNLNTVA